MAKPISKIRKLTPTKEEQQEQNLKQLKEKIANKETALLELLELVNLLQESGLFEAASSAMKAKKDITQIILKEMLKDSSTNAINNIMITSRLFTETNPEETEKNIKVLKESAQAAKESITNDEVLGVFGLIKAMKDPDVNRALRYGITFLKGIGQSLK